MNISIIGKGAIGLLWYKHLFEQLSNNHVNSISISNPTKQKYFSYSANNGYSQHIPLTSADKLNLAHADIILICVKAYQVKKALEQLVNHIGPNTCIILSHNGILPKEHIPQRLAQHTILTLLTTHGSLKANSQHIIHTGQGTTDIGLLQGLLPSNQQISITNLLNDAMPSVNWCDNIKEKQWLKLAINCVINPLTTVYQIRNGDLAQEQYKKQIDLIISEIVFVAIKENVFLKKEELLKLIYQVINNTAQNQSSMFSDYLAKRPTEVDYINGYIHQLGQKHRIATQVNSQLWQNVLALVS